MENYWQFKLYLYLPAFKKIDRKRVLLEILSENFQQSNSVKRPLTDARCDTGLLAQDQNELSLCTVSQQNSDKENTTSSNQLVLTKHCEEKAEGVKKFRSIGLQTPRSLIHTEVKVVSDRGFKQIDEILHQCGCKLIRPPCISTSVKPSKSEVLLTKRIASLRGEGERVIRRVREKKLLEPHASLELKIMLNIDCTVTIAWSLTNFQIPVIRT
ncbi:hypothetical protein TKK_0014017 [Trichogramma kaykai]